MTPPVFNASLALGWVMIVLGVFCLHSLGAALLVGGGLLVAVTLLLAFKTGVRATPHPTHTRGAQHVSD